MRTISIRLAAAATLLAGIAALAGLAVRGLYVDAPNWVQQAQGTDMATLFLAVPLMVLGLATGSRGSSAGRLTVVAGLLYLVYNYAIFAFSVALNPLTALHIAILGFAVWSLVLWGPGAVAGAVPLSERLSRRASGALLIAVGFLFGLLWLGQILSASISGTLPPDLVKAGIASNPVYALDLAIFLPLCVLAGIGVLRGSRWSALAFPMLVWVFLMGAGVVGGMALMAVAGDLTALPVAVVLSMLSLVAAVLAGVAVVQLRGTGTHVKPAIQSAPHTG